MTRFRQALLEELLSRVTDPPAATLPTTGGAIRQTRQTRLRLAFGGAIVAVTAAMVAATVVAAVVLSPAATPTPAPDPIQPAYAITSEADGTVSVITDRVGDATAANQALRSATNGKVVIIPLSPPEDCPVADRGTKVPSSFDNLRLGRELLREQRDNTVRIQPGSIPADWILVLTPGGQLPNNTTPVTWVGWYIAPGPRCVIDPFISER